LTEDGVKVQSRQIGNSQGIDISHYQGKINFNSIKNAGIQFVIIKVSEGIDIIDIMFQTNYQGAKDVGLPVGFYHFAHLSNNPIQEANLYLNTVNERNPDLWHVLDIENGSLDKNNFSKSYISDWSRKWLTAVQSATRKVPMIYTGASFARTYLESDLAIYPLWVAQYGANSPMSNPVWDTWTMFQYGEKGQVDGITENTVDLNEFNGNIQDYLNSLVEEGDDIAMKLEQWQWDMLYTVMGAAYNVDQLDWDWMQAIKDKTLTASQLAFLNTVLDARIDRKMDI
jgi:lysozyme